jgi:Uncharacterized conserved protein
MKKRRLTPSDLAYIIIGSAIVGFSITVFSTPARIAPGGVSGIATIIYHLFSIDTGLTILVLSIPIFLLGLKLFGGQYGIKSLLGSIFLSLCTSLWSLVFGYNGILDYTKDISVWLSCLYGGVLSGIGMGIVMKSGANTGGTDIIAQILARYSHLTLGTCFFIVDGLIILASAFIFGIESALYAIVYCFISTITIDKVLLSMGTNYAKTVYIISDRLDEIGNFILSELDRSGTVLDAKGLYTKESKPMLMTVIPNRSISLLTRSVHKLDPKAFMVIQETYHVLGEGYTPIEKMAESSQNDITQD